MQTNTPLPQTEDVRSAADPAPSEAPACPSECPPEMEAIRLLLRVTRRHNACVERRICTLGMCHSRHRMLMHLARCKQLPSQKELAEDLGISPATVATALKELEREGLIARTATDEDNRRNEIRITNLGLAKLDETRELFESVDRAMFAGIDEEDLRVLSRVVRTMDLNLDAMGAPFDPCRPSHVSGEKKGGECDA